MCPPPPSLIHLPHTHFLNCPCGCAVTIMSVIYSVLGAFFADLKVLMAHSRWE